MSLTILIRMGIDVDPQWVSTTHQALAGALNAGFGLSGVVSALSRAFETPVCVIDLRGSILASTPSRAQWQPDVILAQAGASEGLAGHTLVPIRMSDETVAFLVVRAPADQFGVCRFAADLVSLEFGREHARLDGRRQLAAQVLEDFFNARLVGEQAALRLEEIGVDVTRDNRVIVGQAQTPERRLHSVPWNLHILTGAGRDPYVRAIINGQVVLIVPADAAVGVLAEVTAHHLSALGPEVRVGVGATYPGLAGLRLSYFHARTAAHSNLGVSVNVDLDLSTVLLLSNLDLPLASLGHEILRPLEEYDAVHQAQLTRTLTVFLASDCSSQRASTELFIHRNTLRQRLMRIEELTGRSLASFRNKMHFWIAVTSSGAAMELGDILIRDPDAVGAPRREAMDR